jgi:hypothetical protein
LHALIEKKKDKRKEKKGGNNGRKEESWMAMYLQSQKEIVGEMQE